MHDVNDYPDARQIPGLVVYRYDFPLFFANAEGFKRRALKAIDDADQPVEWLLLNAEANVEVELTSADALAELHDGLRTRGVIVALARFEQDLHDDLLGSALLDRMARTGSS